MSKLNFIAPFFIISDLKKALAFYTDKLGFNVLYTAPENEPFFAMVNRDSVTIMLKAIEPGITAMPNYTRHEWAPWDAYISCEQPDALFKEFNARDITFRKPIHNTDDGLRGFEVMDADGYVLFFGRPKT